MLDVENECHHLIFIKRTTLETFARRTAAAEVAPARAREAMISSPAASTRTRTSGCCSSPRAARRSVRRSGGCRRLGQRRRAGRSSTCCRVWLRHDHHRVATAAGRDAVEVCTCCSPPPGQCAAQPAVGFPQRAFRRVDRDEAGRGRSADRRRDVPRRQGCVPRDPQGPCIRFELTDHSVRVFAGMDSSACAVSVWPPATRSSAFRSSSMSRSQGERAAYLKQANAATRQRQRRRGRRRRRKRKRRSPRAVDEARVAQLAAMPRSSC